MIDLYELTMTADYLQRLLESGDIDEQVYNDSLESLGADEQVESVCKIIRNLEAQVAACKAEEQRIADKRHIAENGIARLKNSLTALMTTMQNKKVSAGLFTVTLCSSKSVEITRREDIPQCFLIPQPPQIDKTGIGSQLRAGNEVAGARLKESAYVRIK